jgi:hypothetical protein
MWLILLVASHAGGWRFTELPAGLMTIDTGHRCMGIAQRKVSALMIKLLWYKLDDIAIAANMFGVTALTLHSSRIGQLAVKASALLHICGNLFMAAQAQTGLSDFVGAVMTIGTFAFQLCMGIADLAGHQQGLKTRRSSDASE